MYFYTKVMYRLITLLFILFPITLFAAPNPSRIAVLELVNKSNTNISRDEVAFLTNEVRRVVGYLPTDRFLVMTKESMAVMIEPGKSLEDCVGQCEVETGRMLNADWIITGELLKFGSSLRASLRLHNTQTGQFIKGESLKGKTVEDLETSIRISTLRIIHMMDPTLRQDLENQVGNNLNQQLEVLRSGVLNSTKEVKQIPQSSSSRSRKSTQIQGKSSEIPKKTSKKDQRFQLNPNQLTGFTLGTGLFQIIGTEDLESSVGLTIGIGYRLTESSYIKATVFSVKYSNFGSYINLTLGVPFIGLIKRIISGGA